MKNAAIVGLLASAGIASGAAAQVITLTAILNGAQENPPISTPASGTATVQINVATGAWGVDLSYSGLSSNVTVSHIHRAAAGVNGPVIIGLDGIALSGGRPSWALITPGPGSQSFSTGGFVNAPFPFPAAEIPNLLNGLTYFNVHTTNNGGGEIRGQIIPAPASAALLGLAGVVATRRRRR